MGFELFNTLAALKKTLGLKIPINVGFSGASPHKNRQIKRQGQFAPSYVACVFLFLQFRRLHGETHATILCGSSERYLLESCFSPYRLHPAAPLALLKFYSKETHLPESLPPRGIYSSSFSDVREMQMFGPKTTSSVQGQSTSKLQQFQSHSIVYPQNSGASSGPALARANTIGGPPSQRQSAVHSLIQQNSALGFMHSRCMTPQQQRNLFQRSGSLGQSSITFDKLSRSPSVATHTAGRGKRLPEAPKKFLSPSAPKCGRIVQS